MYAIGLIADGYTKSRACDKSNITIATFNQYVNQDETLRDMYHEAEQRGYDALAEALLEPDNHKIYGHSDSKMAGVQQKAIMWFLSKKRPKEYGERVQVDVSITADKAITDALLAGKKRAAAAIPHVVDADFIDLPAEKSDEELLAEMGLSL